MPAHSLGRSVLGCGTLGQVDTLLYLLGGARPPRDDIGLAINCVCWGAHSGMAKSCAFAHWLGDQHGVWGRILHVHCALVHDLICVVLGVPFRRDTSCVGYIATCACVSSTAACEASWPPPGCGMSLWCVCRASGFGLDMVCRFFSSVSHVVARFIVRASVSVVLAPGSFCMRARFGVLPP